MILKEEASFDLKIIINLLTMSNFMRRLAWVTGCTNVSMGLIIKNTYTDEFDRYRPFTGVIPRFRNYITNAY